jgi:type IV secretory pathway VirB2 component (pilin)
MKHFIFFLLALLLPTTALAATSGTYTLMAPLTGALGPGSSVDLTTYLQGIVQVIIGIAGILAVIMMVYCGIKLMGTPSASAKSEAKECIWNAVFGVLLALGAWILLYTINPLLLSSELALTDVKVAPEQRPAPGPVTDPYPTQAGWYFKYSDATGIHYNAAGSSAETCAALLEPAIQAGKTILEVNGQKCFQVLASGVTIPQDELSTRNALCGNNSCVGSTPIGINNKPCPQVGSTGCTNVGGLPSSAIDVIKNLQSACNCGVIVTGGTEYWLHKTHAAGQPIFDLNMSVSNFLNANGTGKRASFVNYRVYWNGFWFTNENNHWHVCKAGLSAWYCTNYTNSTKSKQVPETTALLN